jgi:hypothetical protein
MPQTLPYRTVSLTSSPLIAPINRFACAAETNICTIEADLQICRDRTP